MTRPVIPVSSGPDRPVTTTAEISPLTDDACCIGVPSGYVQPDGFEARMCDESCMCESCVLCRVTE